VVHTRGNAVTGNADIVARRLRHAREELGLSQKELGIRAGIDPSVASPRINQYEQATHSPNVRVLGQLASVLGMPLAYFYAVDDDLAALVTAYHRGSNSERQKLMEFVTTIKPKS
jgi:transcriptional regulator with XRE-family HTH domain